MSSTIDERIVQMKFDNDQFEQGVAKTNDSLSKLKSNLNLSGAAKGLDELNASSRSFSLAGIAQGIEDISSKFNSMVVIGIAALANLVVAAVNAGLQLTKSLTIGPISQGYDDYNRKLTSVQTIMNATGKTIQDVSAYFDQLDTYADKTIYNLSDMTSALAKFTNAGIDLDKSVPAIKGIANMVALAGQGADAAAIAMYNLSQSLSVGFLTTTDFRSLNLANVATKEWKNNLIDAAVAAGTLSKNADGTFTIMADGSNKVASAAALFTDELSRGWASATVLLDVLGKYGDTNTVIGAKAQAAAQDVKSFSMMIDTLKASVGTGWTDTFSILIGNLEEAKALFTPLTETVQGILDNMTAARNEPLQRWKDLGGRQALIMSLANAFKLLETVLAPIKAAFEDVFNGDFGMMLYQMTINLAKFINGIQISGKVLTNIRDTFRGVFSVIHIVFTVLGQLGKAIFDLFGFTTQGASGILDFTGAIGNWLTALDQAITKGNGLTKFFDGLVTIIKVPISLIRGLVGIVIALTGAIGDLNGADLGAFWVGLQTRLQPLAAIGQFLITVFGGLIAIIQWLGKVLAPVGKLFMEFAQNLGTEMQKGFDTLDFSGVLTLINTALLGGIIGIIFAFFKTLTGFFTGGGLTGIIGNITGVINSLTGVLQAMQNKLNAQALLAIAGSIGILAVSVLIMSTIDPLKLTSALTGLTVMMLQLLGVMTLFQKIVGLPGILKLPFLIGSMILLGIAVNLLAIAVRQLSGLDWNELARGLIGVTVLLGVLAGAAKLMSTASVKLYFTAPALVAMAIAIKILASAVTDLAGLSWEELAKGVVGLTAVMVLLVGVTKTIGNPAGIIGTAVAFIFLGAALKIIASALQDFGNISWDDLGRGLVAMAGALVVIGIAVNLLPKTLAISAIGLVIVAAALIILSDALTKMAGLSWDDIGRVTVILAGSLIIIALAMAAMEGALPGAAALIVVAFALNIMSDAFLKFAQMSWDDIGRAAVILLGSLIIIAAAMYAMEAALPGAAALLVVSFALLNLAPALMLLGKMSWDEIGRGLAVLAGALGIIALAGILLIPASIGLIGLGIAIALIGAGTILAAIGVAAFAVALTALSIAGTAGVATLTLAIKTFAGLIPYIATQIGLGMLSFAQVIIDNVPIIIEAFAALLLAMLGAVNKVAPVLIDTVVTLIISLVKALLVLVPLLVDAGLQLITGILTGIANNIGAIAEQGYNIIIALIDAMAEKIPDILEAAANLVVQFVQGTADAIRNNSDDFNSAGYDMFKAIIDGVSNAIENNGSLIAYAGAKIGAALLQGAKNALGIHSPSVEFFKVAIFALRGLVNGVNDNVSMVRKPAEAVGEELINTLSKSLASVSDAVNLNLDMSPQIRPVLDLSGLKKDAGLITTMLGSPTLEVDSSYAQAAAVSAEILAAQNTKAKDETKDAPKTGDTIFNQYNNSPKALSSAEIYRQTNNQLSQAKEELAPNAKQN